MKKSTRNPQTSYIVNGKFRLPQLPPNCFGLAVHAPLSAEEVRLGQKAYGDDYVDVDGSPLTVGKVLECGQYTVRNKPYAPKHKVMGEISVPKATDTARLNGKPGSAERIEAMRAYYAQQVGESEGEYNGNSPFSITLEEIANNLATKFAPIYAEYNRNELE